MIRLKRLTVCLAMAGVACNALALNAPAERQDSLLSFIEPNMGQMSPDYSHVARVPAYTTYLNANSAVFLVSAPEATSDDSEAPRASKMETVQMRLVGADAGADTVAGPVLPGRSNYLRGRDSDGWITGVPHMTTVSFADVYPGIAVVYSLQDGSLRYDFVVSPQADVSDIRLDFTGADEVTLDEAGNLRVRSALGELVHSAPYIYQQVNGERREVDGTFAVEKDGSLGFHVATRDVDNELVIDPSVVYSTYLGGSDGDGGQDIAVDASGRMFVSGSTASLDFPVVDPLPPGPTGAEDIFVARFSADGQTLEFATYLGGSATDNPHQLNLDPDGNIVVAGYTSSPDFPIVNAAQPTFLGGGSFDSDGFVLKLSASGDSLVYSTYIGGSQPVDPFFGFEWIRGLTIDADGNAYVVGETSSADFPATQTVDGRGCLDGEAGLLSLLIGDAFVARLAPDGNLDFAVCIGGAERDTGRGIALGDDGSIHITGFTRSDDYPVTPGAYQATLAGAYDTHVTRLNAAADSVLSATYVGGIYTEFAQQVRIAPDGSRVVTGSTQSPDFPTTPGVVQPDYAGVGQSFAFDAIVYRVSANGSDLLFGTYFGGTGDENGWGLELDAQGRIYNSGSTASLDFALVNPTQSAKGNAASPGDEIGSAADDTLALTTGTMLIGGEILPVLVAGNDGVNRLYVLDDAGLPVTSADIGTAADTTRAVALYDSNFDSAADIVVAANASAPSRVYVSDGAGGFLAPVALSPGSTATRAAVVAPLLGTAVADLVIGSYLETNWYYPGTLGGFGAGVAAFPGSAGTATTALAVGDLNGDFIPDVVEGNDGQLNYVYFGNGTGFDAPVAIGIETDPTTSLAVGDVDGDSLVDVVVGNFGAPNRVYRNIGGGTFAAAVDLDPAPAATTSLLLYFTDFDNDLDIIAEGADAGWAYLNDGAGNFDRLPLLQTAEPTTALAVSNSQLSAYSAGPAATPTRFLNVGFNDAYAAVMDITGTKLLFSTYLGGAGAEFTNWGLDIDAAGSVYITGDTAADDFPIVSAYQPVDAGRGDAFVTKIDPEFGGTSPGASYVTTLNLEEPSIDGITSVVLNWSVGVCGTIGLTDYSMSLYAGSERLYTDAILIDGVLQPVGTEPRDPPFWDFDINTLTLNQFNTGADAVIGNPGATGVNYLASDAASLPVDGIVNLAKYDSGTFIAGGAGALASQSTLLVASDCDGDGVDASIDNCSLLPNFDQSDTNGDGIGNRCDADLNNDCIVNAVDLGLLKSVFFSANADADLDGDGLVNVVDLGLLKQLFFQPPGPSGIPNACSF